jgi:hypothetical protein
MSSRTSRWRWWHLPAFALSLGVLCGGAIWIGGDHGGGVWAFVVLAAFAVLIALGGRSELIRGLRGDGRDEYWAPRRPARDDVRGDRRDHRDHRHVPVGVGARPGRLAVRAARRDHRGGIHRRRRAREMERLIDALLNGRLLAEVTHLVALTALNRRS